MVINKINQHRRNTVQKHMILEFMKKTNSHPTAYDVYVKLKDKIPGLTLATVYRNLNDFVNTGILIKLEINKQYHYDYNKLKHFHFICNNKIYDIYSDELDALIKEKIKSFNTKNCKIRNYSLIFYE